MFQRILVPIDLAEASVADQGVNAAADIARRSGAAMRLVHVIDSAVIAAPMLYLPPVDFSQLAVEQGKALESLAKSVDLGGHDVESCVRMGGVYAEVLAEAADWRADLIIVGAHKPSMSTYLLGSSATAIVRHATCSVLVVRGRPAAPASASK
jgi:nucleotide-binding universal stress UspA family protein